MLILLAQEELKKFPQDVYETNIEVAGMPNDKPLTLIQKAPYSLYVLAQNLETYDCVGIVKGDVSQFTKSSISYKEVLDIPQGFMQLVLPGDYGKYMTKQQIIDKLIEIQEQTTTKQIDLIGG